MRTILLLILLSLAVPALSRTDRYDTVPYWMKISLDVKPPTGLTHSDTPVIVISNRVMQKDSLRFMLQERDGRSLHYFIVYSRNGKWHVYETVNLEQAISYMPDKNRDWVTYVEGMGKLFTSDLERGITLTGLYGVNTIMFDYPSTNTSKKQMGNYFFALQNAKMVYRDFLPVLAQIKSLREQKKLGSGHLSMLYHSMGNNMIREMGRHKSISVLNDCVWVDNMVLNAPCVPQAGHRKWLGKIKFAKAIYIHYNPEDFTLGGAFLMSKQNQLGMKVQTPICDGICYINFHQLVGKEHSYFLNLPYGYPAPIQARRHYHRVLHGNAIELSDITTYSPSSYKHIGWDILPDGQDKTTRN